MLKLIQRSFCNQKLQKFTALLETRSEAEQKKKGGENELIATGRSWLTAELRLKSNEQLHKLWYVLLQEKNSVISDASYYQRVTNRKMPEIRMKSVEKSMARLKCVLTERKDVREKFREFLEDEYVAKRQEELKKLHEQQKGEEDLVPKFSFSLLRAKYEALQSNEDNLNYIGEEHKNITDKEKLRADLKEKYDYRRKKIVDRSRLSAEAASKLDANSTIFTFKSQIEEQLKVSKTRISQEEVLRAHIKNWRQLDIKQRRIVLGYLNAMRARDAKREFLKELNLLSQKIAYEAKNISTDNIKGSLLAA